jgi:hypothetical protein
MPVITALEKAKCIPCPEARGLPQPVLSRNRPPAGGAGLICIRYGFNFAREVIHAGHRGSLLECYRAFGFLTLKRAICTVNLSYRSRSRSPFVARPSLTCFSRLVSAST